MASNVDVIAALYQSFGNGDIPAVLSHFDAAIDWQEPESLPLKGQTGPQAVAEHIFGAVIQLVPDLKVLPSEIHGAGDVVFGVGTYTGTGAATGRALEAPFVHVWRMRDGKAVGFRTYTDTHAWLKALGEA